MQPLAIKLPSSIEVKKNLNQIISTVTSKKFIKTTLTVSKLALLVFSAITLGTIAVGTSIAALTSFSTSYSALEILYQTLMISGIVSISSSLSAKAINDLKDFVS